MIWFILCCYLFLYNVGPALFNDQLSKTKTLLPISHQLDMVL